MTTSLGQVVALTAIPVLTATAGGVAAVRRPPGPSLRSGIQHFAAGLVFAAAATELVPDLIQDHDRDAVAIGFAAGLTAMLALARVAASSSKRGSPVALITLVTVDVFIDGILIGAGSIESTRTAVVLTVALALELGFLGVSIAVAAGTSWSPVKTVATTTAVASTIILGGAIGNTALRSASAATLSVVLAFGLVALLYLVTEELLIEAHERTDAAPQTALFFVGFLLLLLLSMTG